MKNINLKLVGVFAFSLLSVSTFAQNWRTGGNAPCPGPQCVDNTNNILGTIDNVPLRMITNNVQRMKIMQGGNTNADGRVAMGNDLPAGFAAQDRLHLHQTGGINAIKFLTNNHFA